MFDNPQQEVNNMSKKLRPVKLSDEAFELFYKEIYAEFGPKDVPPVELNPRKEVQPEDDIIVPDVVEEPEIIEEEPGFTAAEMEEEPEADTEEFAEDPDAAAEDSGLQEEIAQAAALIRNVQDDEIIDEDTEGITLVKPKKEKGFGGLVFTICLELLAIAGIVAYWLLYIL